jgi:hypothetical protein
MLPDFERAERIGAYWGNPATRAFAELLIDCEEDHTLRAVLSAVARDGGEGFQAPHGLRLLVKCVTNLSWITFALPDGGYSASP